MHAGRETDREGVLEWLLPTQVEMDVLPLDLGTGYHLFDSESANPRHLEHELIAARLDSLVRGHATKLWSSEEQDYVDIEPEELISPEDVLILVHSRKHIPDLIKRLQSRGLPVLADKQGQLLQQPVVKPLLSVLSLLAKPSSRLAAHGLVRSPIIGATSVQIEEIFEQKDVENLNSVDLPDEQEEPWCSTCRAFTDYRRKWDTVNRSDLDGGIYSDNIEVPYCINCGNVVRLLSHSKKLVWSVNLLLLFAWGIGPLTVQVLFEFNFTTLLIITFYAGLCYLLSLLPSQSRKALHTWNQAKRDQSIQDLLQKL